MIVRSVDEVEAHERRVHQAAEATAQAVRSIQGDGLELLRRLKFEECGRHPAEDRCLNLIEQLNQTFTYLASFRAVRHLFAMHPEIPAFRLNTGTEGGSDIEDLERQVVAAEVFAAVCPKNNKKLAKDLDKVLAVSAPHRYVFFACPQYTAGRRPAMERGGVQVWAVEL